MPTSAIKILSLAAILSGLAACSDDRTMKERYPGSWRTDFNKGITIALAENQVRVCGEYKYKVPTSESEAYLVRCTRDGRNWVEYLVFVPINRVMGPYTIDKTLD